MGAVFQVQKAHNGFDITCDGISVAWRKDKFNAEATRERLEAEGRLKVRPCLRCKGDFLSEGPHNRMCNHCRGIAATVFEGAV